MLDAGAISRVLVLNAAGAVSGMAMLDACAVSGYLMLAAEAVWAFASVGIQT